MRDARGRSGTHHLTYELYLPDARIMRTRISHPVDRTDYGPSLWKHILRDQLEVDEEEFWACVQSRVRPSRGVPEPPTDALPADLVHLLITRAGVDEVEVARMSKDDAVARLQQYWTENG